MSERKPHKHAEVIKQWADGFEIEFRGAIFEEWRYLGCASPAWHDNFEYRVKTKTYTLPSLELTEEQLNQLVFTLGWLRPDVRDAHPIYQAARDLKTLAD